MKTRIMHSKIYDDSWFRSLALEGRYLFIYLFTNHRIGHTGMYEIGLDTMAFESQIDQGAVSANLERFEKEKKVFYSKGWVYVVKSALYGGYTGEKNELAYKRELDTIPKDIFTYFTGMVPIPYAYGMDRVFSEKNTPINHKSEIIDNKSEIIDRKSQMEIMRKKLKGKLFL